MQILITGVYRSGTEYFSNLLDQHPEVDVSMYTINSLRFMYNKYGKQNIDKKKLLNDLELRLWEKHKMKININKKNLFKLKTYGEIYDFLMTQIYCKKTKNWAEKNQLLWRQTDIFLKSMSNGKVIHILRDPRNVMASFKKYTNSKKPNYLSSAFNSLDAMMYSQRHLKKYPNRFILIKYEDLLLNPRKSMNKVCDFLNIKKNNFYLKKNYFINQQKWVVNSSFQGNIKSSKNFDIYKSMNSYKKNLTIFDRMFVEKICSKYMNFFKYDNNLIDKNLSNKIIEKKVKKSKFMYDAYKNWNLKKKGIQMFPNDPLDSRTWDKIA